MSEYHIHENLPFSIDYENVREPAEAVDRGLYKINPNILLLYSRIDGLPHELLDHLAYLFHADNYDSGYSLEIKRKIIKTAIAVHKYKGTKYAVETELDNIFSGGEVIEWYEYGGEPYTFRIVARGNHAFSDKKGIEELVKVINSAKNVRSWLEYNGITVKFDDEKLNLRQGIISPVKTVKEVGIGGIKDEIPLFEIFGFLPSEKLKGVNPSFLGEITVKNNAGFLLKNFLPKEIKTNEQPREISKVLREEALKIYTSIQPLYELPKVNIKILATEKTDLFQSIQIQTPKRQTRTALPKQMESGFYVGFLFSLFPKKIGAKLRNIDPPKIRETRLQIKLTPKLMVGEKIPNVDYKFRNINYSKIKYVVIPQKLINVGVVVKQRKD